MPVKGLQDAPGSRPPVEAHTLTIYLAKGIAYLTPWKRVEAIKVYPGTSAVIAAVKVKDKDGNESLAPASGWLRETEGEWTAAEHKADTKNRDVYTLDSGEAKFAAGPQMKPGFWRSHVAAYPGTTIVVAEGQALENTVGGWVKVSGKVKAAEPAPAKAATAATHEAPKPSHGGR